MPNEALRDAVERVRDLVPSATATLARALVVGVSPVELRAAVAVMDLAFRGAALLDLTERLAALEKQKEEP